MWIYPPRLFISDMAEVRNVGQFKLLDNPFDPLHPLECLCACSVDETIFIAQIAQAQDFEHVRATTAVSAQLELLGRLGAQ